MRKFEKVNNIQEKSLPFLLNREVLDNKPNTACLPKRGISNFDSSKLKIKNKILEDTYEKFYDINKYNYKKLILVQKDLSKIKILDENTNNENYNNFSKTVKNNNFRFDKSLN